MKIPSQLTGPLGLGCSGVGYWKDGRAGSLLKKIQAERACGLNGAALWKRVASVTTANANLIFNA